MILRNVDNFMTPFLRMLYDGVQLTFNTMQSIEFGNTNMLEVMVTIMVLGIAIPIILTLAQNNVSIKPNQSEPEYIGKHSERHFLDHYGAMMGVRKRSDRWK